MKENIMKILKNPVVFMISLILLIILSTVILNISGDQLYKEEKISRETENLDNKDEKEINAVQKEESIIEHKPVEGIVVNEVELYKENSGYEVRYVIDNNGKEDKLIDNKLYFGDKTANDDIYEENTVKAGDGIVFPGVSDENLSKYIENKLSENKEIKLYKKIYEKETKKEIGTVEIVVPNKIIDRIEDKG